MRRYRITVDGHLYDVEVDDPKARPVTARVAGQLFRVDVEAGTPVTERAVRPQDTTGAVSRGAASGAAQAPPPSSSVPGQQRLTAPIPGTISKVVATVGQVVERGDALLTIEAMKMFNVIRSPRAGTVTAVHVTEGKHVTQGELLLTFILL